MPLLARRMAGTMPSVGTTAAGQIWAWQAPMLATLAKSAPAGEWVYQRKLDGLRCIAMKHGDDVQLLSRNQLSFNARFASVVAAVGALGVDDVVLDGELIAWDARQRTSFAALQHGQLQVEYHVFDIVSLLGQDTRALPLEERMALVSRLVGTHEVLKSVESLAGSADELLAQACREGWEGLIGKRQTSIYRSGRSTDWIKLKCTSSQELVIGGWTEPKGARVGFGALLMGYYEDGEFIYAGKVGTGFNRDLLHSLYADMARIEQPDSPFLVKPNEGHVHWVSPCLVASIEFAQWTSDGRMRHPTFQGLRPDKAAEDVRREA